MSLSQPFLPERLVPLAHLPQPPAHAIDTRLRYAKPLRRNGRSPYGRQPQLLATHQSSRCLGLRRLPHDPFARWSCLQLVVLPHHAIGHHAYPPHFPHFDTDGRIISPSLASTRHQYRSTTSSTRRHRTSTGRHRRPWAPSRSTTAPWLLPCQKVSLRSPVSRRQLRRHRSLDTRDPISLPHEPGPRHTTQHASHHPHLGEL